MIGVAAAKLAGRPVRVTLSREGVYRVVGGRTLTEQRVAIGAAPDGGFDALVHTGLSVMTPNNDVPEPSIEGTRASYAASHIALRVETARTDMRANTYMRGPGEAVGTFALESAIDELAVAMDVDPVALRLHNEPDKNPTSGLPFSSRHIVEAWRQGAEQFGRDRRAAPGTRREGQWLAAAGAERRAGVGRLSGHPLEDVRPAMLVGVEVGPDSAAGAQSRRLPADRPPAARRQTRTRPA